MKGISLFLVLILTPCLLIAQLEHQIPKYSNGDTSFWYKWVKQNERGVGLKGMITDMDSLHFRLSVSNYFLDIVHVRDNQQVEGSLIIFTTSFNKKVPEESGKFFSSQRRLNSDTAKLIYDLVLDNRILEIPSCDSINGWFMGHDGITYTIQIATQDNYHFRSYWTPQHFTQIPEAVRVNSFIQQVERILQTGDRLDAFIETLPVNNCYRYHSMGMLCKESTKKKRKGAK